MFLKDNITFFLSNQSNSHVFLRKVVTLIAGTVSAQAIWILISPVLTRVYSPESFGFYGVFMSIISIGVVFATWRYERAIVISRSKSEVHALFILILCLSFMLSMSAFIFVKIMVRIIPHDVPIYIIFNKWSWLVALGLCVSGLRLSFRFLALRKEAFKIISIADVLQIIIMASIQIGLGLILGGMNIGLPVGITCALCINILFFAFFAYKKNWLNYNNHRPSFQHILTAARRNSIYPRYMTWSSVCNAAAPEVPFLLLGFLFLPNAIGQFFLAQRVSRMPFGIVSGSISEVNLQDGSERTPSNLKKKYHQRVKKLFTISIPPFGIFFIVAPWLFSFVFGETWKEAGILTRLLIPGLLIQFVFTPFTPLFTVLKEQRVYLYWAIMRLLAVFIGVILGVVIGEIRGASMGYSFAIAFSFVIQHFILVHLLNTHSEKELSNNIKTTF
jgi:O-antigen/teichoic acid export membrane protein